MEDLEVQVPQSIAEAEELVKRLYQPGPPSFTHRLQEELQKLQQSTEGWRLADILLGSDDNNVRFFGALTFYVKVNSAWESLTEDDANFLLDRLITWLITSVSRDDPGSVVRKLHQQRLAAVYFATSLAEERQKLPRSPQNDWNWSRRMEENFPAAAVVMCHAMRHVDGDLQAKVRAESFVCFKAWAYYAQIRYNDATRIGDITQVTRALLECVAANDTAGETLAELLHHCITVFGPPELHAISALIRGTWGQQRLNECENLFLDREGMIFCDILHGYAAAHQLHLVQTLGSDTTDEIMLIRRLDHYETAAETYNYALDYWNNFADHAEHCTFDTSGNHPWLPAARTHLLQAAGEWMPKIRYPPQNEFDEWDAEPRTSFDSLRNDFKVLLQKLPGIVGPSLLQEVVGLTLASLQDRAWLDIEANLFCLGTLSATLTGDNIGDATLTQLFSSELFTAVYTAGVPRMTRLAAIDTIARFSGSFLSRHPHLLQAAINYLSPGLSYTALVNEAASAMHTLCISCREPLVFAFDYLVEVCARFSRGPIATNRSKALLLGAAAAITQALPTDASKDEAITRLVTLIEVDVAKARKMSAAGNLRECHVASTSVLQGLHSMASASRAPEDAIIGLVEDKSYSNYWHNGGGIALQRRIESCLDVIMNLLPEQSDIAEEAFSVLRCGFTERLPGPFVLPSAFTVQTFLRVPLTHPSLAQILAVVGEFVSARAKDYNPFPSFAEEGHKIILRIVEIFRRLEVPGSDPEVAQNSIDVLDRLAEHDARFLTEEDHEDIWFVVDFTIAAIRGPAVPPKRSAAKLWTTLIGFTLPPLDAESIQRRKVFLDNVGEALCAALVYNYAGQAARDDLDWLSEPLKKLVGTHPKTTEWLSRALRAPDFPVPALDDGAKDGFVSHVHMMSNTKQVVYLFWSKCKDKQLVQVPH
ncbi:member of the karyopherin-beta [Coniosporium tulheliwenetii]|uniref:Member of the karyopherin-beta n=1 Tax=Coniosporium tulheliwenetii TaxID=3383036 RepID=A0ACC2Z6W9_9PEZI|nr:member of the karyopherin-beta [Cladosporium sp. JES 115]